jgi:HAE1 family hydrophobic/amphiphilic exporter-1
MALVGLVMLTGIVVNNGIVLVDYINQLHRGGMPLREAVEEGGRVRLRPVLMTALTTILGMMPLAFELGSGSESWSPLARAVIGGLTTSTILTLLVIPIMFILLNTLANKVKKKFALQSLTTE